MRASGTPWSDTATWVIRLGFGELGREVAIELQRLGYEMIAVDRYANARAIAVAHRWKLPEMNDPAALRALVESEVPTLIVPEIEPIATEALIEAKGHRVVPTGPATRLTMDRDLVPRLAANELGLPTSPFRFAATECNYHAAVEAVGLPWAVKPVMSSSGKRQSTVRRAGDLDGPGAIRSPAAAARAPGSSSKASSNSITRSHDCPWLARTGRVPAPPESLVKSTAIIARSLQPQPKGCSARRPNARRAQSPPPSAAAACSRWARSWPATGSGSPRSRHDRRTPVWSGWPARICRNSPCTPAPYSGCRFRPSASRAPRPQRRFSATATATACLRCAARDWNLP